MAVRCEAGLPWVREHDDPRSPHTASALKTCFPASLEELLEVCTNADRHALKAQGSHWSLSEAAVSDHTFIETHDRSETRPVLGATLRDVVPHALSSSFVNYLNTMSEDPATRFIPVHVEAGKRIYQLYAELDQPLDPDDPESLAGHMTQLFGHDRFSGSWALATAGNAGGQTIMGAISTGTHGGDFRIPPLADAVLALHLVADGGKHYWIEPTPEAVPEIADESLLREIYGADRFGGPDAFEVIRDEEMFNAALVSVGRFGTFYSVVLRAVPQYNLFERRVLGHWQNIKDQIRLLDGPLFEEASNVAPPAVAEPVDTLPRGLQIVVLLTPQDNFTRNRVGITRRWKMELPEEPGGRAQRVGAMLTKFDPILRAPRFERAGNYVPWTAGEEPHAVRDPTLLETACSNGNFIAGILEGVINELEDFVSSHGFVVGGTIAAIAVPGAGGLLGLLGALAFILRALKEILEAITPDVRRGELIEKMREVTVGNPNPSLREAGVFAWQMIALRLFESQQGPHAYDGISYAILDGKDYTQVSCEKNVASMEVFFDATGDELVAFIDALIAFEIGLEIQGRAFAGYASLRFMGPSRATLGEQKHRVTCAVEVAGIADVDGSEALVEHAIMLARHPVIGGVLHWGQLNPMTRTEVERVYATSDLQSWRRALMRITDGGRLEGFSSDFTRSAGLESL